MSNSDKFSPVLNIIDISPHLIKYVNAYLKHYTNIEINDKKINMSDYITCNASVTDITELNTSKNTAFVSAANGEGFLGGGVDAALRNMFSDVQPIIREAVIENGYINGDNDQFIPVGSATIVPVTQINKLNQFLITSPTMLSPSNVSFTENCYYALYATLRLVKKFNESLKREGKPQIDKIYCPGLGTGVGGMSSKNAAQQFVKAIVDFILYDLTDIMKPTKDNAIYINDISSNDNAFVRAPREFIMSQPHWKSFMRKSKYNQWGSLLGNSDMSDETLATIMGSMSDVELASNFPDTENNESDEESDDDDIENFVLRPSKGTKDNYSDSLLNNDSNVSET
jgi:O-acetyl-ADP-ribose deacetylase (regulator of RNase III)